MNDLQLTINQNQIFHNDLFGDLTTLTDQSTDIWFIGEEVVRMLGYQIDNTSTYHQYIYKYCDNSEYIESQLTGYNNNLNSENQQQHNNLKPRGKKTLIINESAFYSLVFQSPLSEAKQIKKWVTSEVLPSIRKHGSYVMPNFSDPAQAAIAWAEQYTLAQEAIRTKAEIGSRREATAMNTASQAVKKIHRLEVELDKSREYATIKRVQCACGGAYKFKPLKNYSIAHNLEIIKVFDANYSEGVNAYHADAWYNAYGIDILELVAA